MEQKGLWSLTVASLAMHITMDNAEAQSEGRGCSKRLRRMQTLGDVIGPQAQSSFCKQRIPN